MNLVLNEEVAERHSQLVPRGENDPPIGFALLGFVGGHPGNVQKRTDHMWATCEHRRPSCSFWDIRRSWFGLRHHDLEHCLVLR